MAQRIDGKAVAAEVISRVKAATTQLKQETGLTPGIAVVIVGEDPASQVYVRSKGRMAEECGFKSVTHRLAETTGESELLALLDSLNADASIHGILVQLPLPKQMHELRAREAVIEHRQDVDGLAELPPPPSPRPPLPPATLHAKKP